MRAIVMRAAHTMSLMTLDVPGMHLSMSVVHSTNVSLLRGSGGAVSARATIRQPMTVKAEAPTNSPSGKCTLLENTAMTPPVSWRTSSSFYGKSACPRRSFKTSQRRQRRDYHLPGAQCWLQSSGVIDRHCFPFHYSRLEAKRAWGAIRSYTRGCLALLGYRRPVPPAHGSSCFYRRSPSPNEARGCDPASPPPGARSGSASSRSKSAKTSAMSLARFRSSAAGVCANRVRR
jgi:hypothetical protein